MTLPLTTISALEAELSLTAGAQDDYLASLIGRASARLESLCGGRRFGYEEDVVEFVAGFGTQELLLERAPITAITSIELDGEALDATSYAVHAPDTGIVHRDGSLWLNTARRQGVEREPVQGTQSPDYKVTYSAGYITPQQKLDDDTLTRTLPYDIEEAVLALAVQSYRSKGKDLRAVKQEIMSAKVTYSSGSASMPACVKDVVRQYGRWS